MKFKQRPCYVLIGILIFLISACTGGPATPEITQPTILTFPTSTAPAGELETYTETPSPPHTIITTPDVNQSNRWPRYHLDLLLDYLEKSLSVSQTVTYTNNTDQPHTILPLLIPPAKTADAFQIKSLVVKTPNFTNELTTLEDIVINIHLEPPLQPGETITLHFEYDLNPPGDNQSFGYTDRQLLLVDWHLFIPPYIEGQGWLINPPGQVGEYLVYPLSDFNVRLCLTSYEKELVIAASVPPYEQKEDCYHYQYHHKRTFTLGISPEYQVATAQNDQVTVTAYTFPKHADLGQRAADLALRSWEVFTDLFGDSQRDHLSIVEADMYDGLESDGLYFLSDWYYQTADETPKNYFELLTIHETAHQWFFGLIHNDQANQPWLDEALATYSELLFYERNHPELVNWWWEFRVHDFNPRGDVNATIYEFDTHRPYINAVYLRGVSFLHEIRQRIGNEAFLDFLYAYVQTDLNNHAIRDAEDFFIILSQFTDEDLSDIIVEYFRE